MKQWCLSLAFGVLAMAAVSADNWPQWRGPQLNGTTGEKGLPVKSEPHREHLVEAAHAEPQRRNPHHLEQPHLPQCRAVRRDRRSRALVRGPRQRPGVVEAAPQRREQSAAKAEHVVAVAGHGRHDGLGHDRHRHPKSFDFAGKELWSRDIQKDYGPFGLNWGYASSPLLHEGALYVQVLHGMKTDDPSYVMRIDKATGKTVWKVDRPTDAVSESPDAYTTPALVRIGNATEIVISGGDVVTGHDPATGKELWRANGLNPTNDRNYRIIASPVVAAPGVVIAPTRQRPMLALKPGGRGDVTTSHKLWEFNNGPDVPTPTSDGKYLYIVNDGGVVYCLDLATGAAVYGPERLKPGTYSASPTLADGRLYVTSEEGIASVFAAGPKFQLLAENPIEEYTLSSIAVSRGQLFLRTDKHLYAIGTAKPTSP